MDFLDKQIPPPKSWEKFEDLTRALFAAVWKSPLTQKNGRTGQKQHGVDVYGASEAIAGKNFGVQCKGKNGGYGAKATTAEFDAELTKAENFKPALGHWAFATSAPNDGPLQEHARRVSEQRQSEGRFPVVVIGWETFQALLSSHQAVIEEFYPEQAGDLPKIMEALRALPGADELDQIRRSLITLAPRSDPLRSALPVWSEVKFETARDLGPALMGRPLGPGDVAACPVLPEAALLLADLERAGSARLAGVPGAGKSISLLQVAREMHERGWRVLRLADPMGGIPPFDADTKPALYIVDDAHLSRAAWLRELEEQATASRWVLSAHTISDDKGNFPGTIHLDAKRAVRVIADGLRVSPATTLAAVRRVDDRVGDRIGQEWLESRLEQAAEQALFPWQFCFILGGGWRRASALASSARAAAADLVLAAAAIRQLATRDARCSRDALTRLIDDASLVVDSNTAIAWLLAQRLLLSEGDLRCPHQRLSSVLLARILEGQSLEGRQSIAEMLRATIEREEMPLDGIGVLLGELSRAGERREWCGLVQPAWLSNVLARCWSASEPIDIRNACWMLTNVDAYLPNKTGEFSAHKKTLAKWIQVAPKGACYAIGRVANDVFNTDEALGMEIVALVDPHAMARAMNAADHLHAGEIANLLSSVRAHKDDVWKARYLEHVDRDACHRLVSAWPHDAYLSIVADVCRHFCIFEPELGYSLIESLIPAISDRLRVDPQDAFHELNDIVWDALRLHDPLDIYVGRLAPSRRMRQVGRKISACWSPTDLAAKLSRSTHRNFQSAASLLCFMRKVSPKQFEATVLALDWKEIDRTIGSDWAEDIGDARMILGVAYAVPVAQQAIQAMVAHNEPFIVTMSTHLAALAPASALRHVAAGKRIALHHWGSVDWELGAFVLAKMIQSDPTLIPAFLEPHYGGMAQALSQPHPSYYKDSLMFLRLLAQVRPDSLARVLDAIDVDRARVGWRNALLGRENHRTRGASARSRQVASFLIHHALDRAGPVGELSRELRFEFPKRSIPLAKTIEHFDLDEPCDSSLQE